ncbi:hypothetical protein [Dysgonomonas termitidis]
MKNNWSSRSVIFLGGRDRITSYDKLRQNATNHDNALKFNNL